MSVYFVPFFSAVMGLVSVLLCLVCIFKRRGLFWLLPFFASLAVLCLALYCLWMSAGPSVAEDVVPVMQRICVISVLLSFFWLASLLSLRSLTNVTDEKGKARIEYEEREYQAKKSAKRKGKKDDSVHLVKIKQ